MNTLAFEMRRQNTPENQWFVARATMALIKLMLRPQGVPEPRQGLPRRNKWDGVCGLGLIPKDMRRFWPKVRVTEECWEWTGYVASNGYGRFRAGDENRLAHRCSYEFFNGRLPEGLTLDHLCSNRRCVNPDHLEAVTLAENNRRYREKL